MKQDFSIWHEKKGGVAPLSECNLISYLLITVQLVAAE